MKHKKTYRVGVISDTHGLLREQVLKVFQGVDLILHAGDVDREEIIKALTKLSPVIAVRGNMDSGWAGQLAGTQAIEIGQVSIYMLHNLNLLDLIPETAGFQAVISGHTHQPHIYHKAGVLYLNPGSAGPRRFDYPISVARLEIEGTELRPEIVMLKP